MGGGADYGQAAAKTGPQASEIGILEQECRERLAAVEADLRDLADCAVEVSTTLIDRTLRGLAGLRSAAGRLARPGLEPLSRAAEDVLAGALEGAVELTSVHGWALLAAHGAMQEMLAQPAGSAEADFSIELGRLGALVSGVGRPAPAFANGAGQGEAAQRPRQDEAEEAPQPLRALVVGSETGSAQILELLSRYGAARQARRAAEAVEMLTAAQRAGAPYSLCCFEYAPPLAGHSLRRVHAALRRTARARLFLAAPVSGLGTAPPETKALCDAILLQPATEAGLRDHLRAFHLIPRG